MREKTVADLFGSYTVYRRNWSMTDPCGNELTCVTIDASGKVALIQEFKEESDGLEVYVQTEGNSLLEARRALGVADDMT